MSKRNEVNILAIFALTLLLAAALIFYIGMKAHAAESGEYQVIVELRMPPLLSPPPEDDFERHHDDGLIKTLIYITPGFDDYSACMRFITTDKNYLKRLSMLYEFAKKSYGSITVSAHCGARVD